MKECGNDNFRDQLAAADVIISNKATGNGESHGRWRLVAALWRRSSAVRQPGQYRPGAAGFTASEPAPLPASAEHAHSHGQKRPRRAQPAGTSALAPASSTAARAIRPAAGFLTPIRFDTIGLLEWARLAPVGRVKGVMRIAEGLVRINRQGGSAY
jgi:G3E family GTPase